MILVIDTYVYILPVLLLASLDSNLGKSQGDEQTKMPGHHVEPEGVSEGWSLWEVGQVGADALSEESEQGLSSERRDSNVGWDEPSGGSNHQGEWLLLEPFVLTSSCPGDDNALLSGSGTKRWLESYEYINNNDKARNQTHSPRRPDDIPEIKD